MTRSDVEVAKEMLLPEKGADFEIEYFNDQGPVKYGEGHAWANAVSPGMRVVCFGPEFRVSMTRQMKPMVPKFLMGDDGCYRRALRIGFKTDEIGNGGEVYIHILGDLIIVTTEKIKVAKMVNDQSLTESDAKLLEAMRSAADAIANAAV